MIHSLALYVVEVTTPADTGTNPGDLIKWILASVGLLVFLGATAQFLRGSADKGTITSLKDSVSALQTENTIIKQQRENDRQIIAEQGERISKLEGENAILHNAVAHVEEITHLQESLDAHHRAAMQKTEEILKAVKT